MANLSVSRGLEEVQKLRLLQKVVATIPANGEAGSEDVELEENECVFFAARVESSAEFIAFPIQSMITDQGVVVWLETGDLPRKARLRMKNKTESTQTVRAYILGVKA